MRSSYKENNYGSVLLSLIIGKAPEVCVELGVLDGYSTMHIAKGLKFNYDLFGIDGKLFCWDLWDMYEYNHGDKNEVQKRLDKEKLTPFVYLKTGDAFETPMLFPEKSVTFLHVDISNTGSVLKKIMDYWNKRMKNYGMIVFEGGSKERDNIEWMIKYKKPSIYDELRNNEIIKNEYKFITLNAFPSMTILQKKGMFL